jgi:BirA family biotin operon repressor/biotin-[acetyl-CoA-carboxylase] ligase
MTAPAATFSLDTARIGRRVLRFAEVASTNTLALTHAEDAANDGLVIWADHQTAGRGRFERTWLSPPGHGVLLSVLLFPPDALRLPSMLTALAAVSVCEAVYATTQLQTRIKWPNDVLIRGRKVCGILVEQRKGAVIGIGLNVSTPSEMFKEHGLEAAGSLALFTERPPPRDDVAHALLRQLDSHYEALLRGEFADLEARWRWHTALLGKHVQLETTSGSYFGRVRDLTLRQVLLDTAEGTRGFVPETVEQVKPLQEDGSLGGRA